jgi:3D (Asp-Asp-Asp) domain-containing protein
MRRTHLFTTVFLAIGTIILFCYFGYLAEPEWFRAATQNVTGRSDCSDGWRITGYFTPVETDFDGPESSEIDVVDVGPLPFEEHFLRVIFDESKGFGEGWGKTRFGWYLGEYDGQWHKSNAPLDAHDAPLKVNSIAVDNTIIPNNSIVKIPNLPDQYGRIDFISNDVGVTVHGKHIDIYTGEGKAAEQEMNLVTFEDSGELQRVCFSPPSTQP